MVAFATGGTSLCLVLVPLLGINGGSESCPSCESQIHRGSSKTPLPVLHSLINNTSAAHRPSKDVLHRARNSGLSWKQGMYISKHDSAPDKLLFHLQPLGFRRAGRRIPEKILEHDKVIWFGDLNYCIALSYADTKKLLMDNNWDALFEKNQLKIERDAGRVFKGWNEGKIYFAPTYKYSYNSDAYAGETATSNKKRRTPTWCIYLFNRFGAPLGFSRGIRVSYSGSA